MKKLIIVGLLIMMSSFLFAQKSIPSVRLKKFNGETVDIKEVVKKDKIVILSFWATWCKPCIAELTAVADLLDDWKEETGVKFIAVSIDDSRSSSRVKSFVKGRDWQYDIYLDDNQNLKRALGINLIPHVFIIKNGKIVWEHSSYVAGDEDVVYEKLLEVKNEK
ncbi:MAG: TlpA family protein disulfide reductase [Marinifilaceae bacterium]|jgi:thiol-disulfide isomerase/thioredoxin|nr:TlpA family protein disulfide reductase [Marinifilaceae bacterium]